MFSIWHEEAITTIVMKDQTQELKIDRFALLILKGLDHSFFSREERNQDQMLVSFFFLSLVADRLVLLLSCRFGLLLRSLR